MMLAGSFVVVAFGRLPSVVSVDGACSLARFQRPPGFMKSTSYWRYYAAMIQLTRYAA